jgi:hypothetical protein
MNRQNNTLLFSALFLVVAAAFTRLFPHPPNFTAIGAMAIFGGSVIKDKKLALLLPLAALFLSDVCLHLFTPVNGFYGISQIFVYGAFILITLLATNMRKRSVGNIAFAAVWSSAIFFLISNVGVWLASGFYAKSISGLMACYATAIPFYKNDLFGNFILNSVMSNLFYTALLFGAYYVVERSQRVQKAIA